MAEELPCPLPGEKSVSTDDIEIDLSATEEKTQDIYVTPPGKGVVIVPALTKKNNEPFWLVQDKQKRRVSKHLTGDPAILDPGHYTILAGSGYRSQMTNVPVEVKAGGVIQIKPTWGALVVHTIDETETPFRGVYEMFSFTTRDSFGIGRGAEEELGEEVKTWLLKPDIYKIIGPTENFRSIQNFATVQVHAGEITHFAIVMNRTSGQFMGSGIVSVGDFTVKGAITGNTPQSNPERLKVKWLVGGNFNQSSEENNVSLGSSRIGVGLFSALGINYLRKKHFWNFIVNVEAGIRKNSNENFVRKATDQLDISTIYLYRLTPLLSPYARISASSHFAKSFEYFDDPTTVVIQKNDCIGNDCPSEITDRLQLEEGIFDPTLLEEGVGLNFNLIKNLYLDLDTRMGLGWRHTLTGGFLVKKDDPDTLDQVEFQQIGRVHDIGGEMIVIAASQFTRRFSYTGEVNLFQGGHNTFRFQMNNTFIWRFSRSVSLVFLLGFHQNQRIEGRFEISQASFLKFDQLFFR